MQSIEPRLTSKLKTSGIYQRLKASPLYDLYSILKDRRWIDRRNDEVKFYRELLIGLQPGDLIFDVGANDGTKTDMFLRLGAKVVAVDPDETCQNLIRGKFLRYRLFPKPVRIVAKAVSGTCSYEAMRIDGPGSALNTLSRKWSEVLKSDKVNFEGSSYGLNFEQTALVETTTLEELTGTYGDPFYIKIDVEGYEVHVLQGLKHPVPFLSFEINLPEFRPEGLECVRTLEALESAGLFNYSADCQRGVALDSWVEASKFASVLEQCTEKSIEVFWKTEAISRR